MDQKNLNFLKEFALWLILLSMSMKAGLSFIQSLKTLTQKWPHHPLSKAWGVFLSELHLGKSKVEALNCFQTHLPKTFMLETFCQTLLLSFRQGMGIADLFLHEAHILFTLYINQMERRIYQKQFKMLLPLFLLILPAVFILIATPILIQLKGAL